MKTVSIPVNVLLQAANELALAKSVPAQYAFSEFSIYDDGRVSSREEMAVVDAKELGLHFDPVNKPKHYNSHPSGVQCIEVTRHMGFNLGNAVKYIWRADKKGAAVQDLEKAIWYIQDEIAKRKGEKRNT